MTEAHETSENLRGNVSLGYRNEAVNVVKEWVLKEYGVKICIGFVLLRRELICGLLQT